MHLEAAHPGEEGFVSDFRYQAAGALENTIYGYWVVVEGENTGSLTFLRA
jgi:hypothetical protein